MSLRKKSLKKLAIFSALLLSYGVNSCYAQDAFTPLQMAVPFEQTQEATGQQLEPAQPAEPEMQADVAQPQSESILSQIKKGPLNESDVFLQLTTAVDKFCQCNIRASRDDFNYLVNNSIQNDFVYLAIADKMAELGLFDMASLSISKIKDKDIAGPSISAIKKYYYPKRKLKLDDELSLAEAYSDILYNNQSSEATSELLKNQDLLLTSDYANYLVALGSYKSNFLSQAEKYIDFALLQNPENLNYQTLQAKIYAQKDDSVRALKIVENLKKQNLYAYEFDKKIKALEQFVLYKLAKNEHEKDYRLGYYYYFEDDNQSAINALQGAVSKKRASNGSVYALMARIYFDMSEFEKASDSARKAYKINFNNPEALIVLGDLKSRDKDFDKALAYYKKACSKDKKSYEPFVKLAQSYQRLNNEKKAKEIYIKILKTHFDCAEAYYNIALLDKDKKEIYLKKALAVNPMYEGAWVELAGLEVIRLNYEAAQKYLANAYYIDENDFRYYYYQGLIAKNSGDVIQAQENFRKCLMLNPDFKDAQKEIGILKVKSDQIKQGKL